jgi:hypothetical protein
LDVRRGIDDDGGINGDELGGEFCRWNFARLYWYACVNFDGGFETRITLSLDDVEDEEDK